MKKDQNENKTITSENRDAPDFLMPKKRENTIISHRGETKIK